MENNLTSEHIKMGIEAYTKYNLPVPDGLKDWCKANGREDLLGEISVESQFLPLPSRAELAEMLGVKLPADMAHESLEEPATEADVDSMMRFALEGMARDLNIELPANLTSESEYDKNGELPSMEEIFGMKRKE